MEDNTDLKLALKTGILGAAMLFFSLRGEGLTSLRRDRDAGQQKCKCCGSGQADAKEKNILTFCAVHVCVRGVRSLANSGSA